MSTDLIIPHSVCILSGRLHIFKEPCSMKFTSMLFVPYLKCISLSEFSLNIYFTESTCMYRKKGFSIYFNEGYNYYKKQTMTIICFHLIVEENKHGAFDLYNITLCDPYLVWLLYSMIHTFYSIKCRNPSSSLLSMFQY